MTLEEAVLLAPAVGTTAPASYVSSRYTYIPTHAIADKLISNGWTIRSARQNDRTDPFATHSLTFDLNNDTLTKRIVGEVTPTVHLINSHNATRRLTFTCGLHICICSNQAHAPFHSDTVNRMHVGGAYDVSTLIDSLLDAESHILSDVLTMQRRQLTLDERETFAIRAVMHAARHINPCFVDRPTALPLLVAPRESQLHDHSLWTTYNVVQENLIERGRTGRGIHEILNNSRLNQLLWTEATALLN